MACDPLPDFVEHLLSSATYDAVAVLDLVIEHISGSGIPLWLASDFGW